MKARVCIRLLKDTNSLRQMHITKRFHRVGRAPWEATRGVVAGSEAIGIRAVHRHHHDGFAGGGPAGEPERPHEAAQQVSGHSVQRPQEAAQH